MDASNHEGSGIRIECVKGINFDQIIIPQGSILLHSAWEDGERIFTILNGFCQGMEVTLLDSEIVNHFKLL